MGYRTRLVALGAVAMLMVGGLAACSDDDSGSSSTNDTAGSTGGTTGEDKTWCNSVQNLIDQSGGGDLSVSGNLAALSEALVSLATTSPDAIYDDMQTLATVSSSAVELEQSDPTATLPEAAQTQAADAWESMDTWVSENCGIEVPALTA